MRRRLFGAIAALIALPAAAGSFQIDWWTVDSGGGLESENGPWRLSGTIGQWDATSQPMSGGQWTLEAGFWTFQEVERGDAIFRDRFEGE